MNSLIHTFEADTCPQVWLAAAEFLLRQPAQSAFNLVLAARTPAAMTEADFALHHHVDDLLRLHGRLAVATVASTIFPANFYMRGGASGVYEDFLRLSFPERWAFYALRMLRRRVISGGRICEISPLQILVTKMKAQLASTSMRAAYEINMLEADELLELPIFNAGADSRLIRGQPCLSHLSFKLLPDKRQVTLTALYRHHFYVERALGNLVGLAQLLRFVAAETSLSVGPLICHSTLARLDGGPWGVRGLKELLQRCRAGVAELHTAAEEARHARGARFTDSQKKDVGKAVQKTEV